LDWSTSKNPSEHADKKMPAGGHLINLRTSITAALLWAAIDGHSCEFKTSGIYVKADTTGKDGDSLIYLRQKVIRFAKPDSMYFKNSGMVIQKGDIDSLFFSEGEGYFIYGGKMPKVGKPTILFLLDSDKIAGLEKSMKMDVSCGTGLEIIVDAEKYRWSKK
jgi:hypothetical protein